MASNFKLESGVQLLARLTKKPDLHNFYPILFSSGPKYGDIIEICSNNVSPSHLLCDMICEALILYNLDGPGVGVLVFKTDGELKYEELISRLRQKLITHASSRQENQVENVEIDNFLRATLSNLFITEIYDATQLYTTIHNLDNILMKHQNITFIIFDTLTAFYWSEQGFIITKMDSYLKKMLTIIQNVTKEYKVTCFYTRPEYFSSRKDSEHLENNEYPLREGLNYRVHILDKNDEGDYQVNVKTTDTYFEKLFNVHNT